MGQRDREDVASDSDEIVAVFSPMYLVDACYIAKRGIELMLLLDVYMYVVRFI